MHFNVWPEQLDEMDLDMVAWMTNRLCEYLANHETFLQSHIAFFDDALRAPEETGLDEYQGPRIEGQFDDRYLPLVSEELRG